MKDGRLTCNGHEQVSAESQVELALSLTKHFCGWNSAERLSVDG